MIIGVTGPIAAGTDSFAFYLQKKKFESFSYSDVLREHLHSGGEEITRGGLQAYANQLRRQHGTGILSSLLFGKMNHKRDYVIGNIRHPGEVYFFEGLPEFTLVCIEASAEIRFERAKSRNRERDPKTWEEFLALDAKDYGVGEPLYGQQHAAVFALARYRIQNEGSLSDLGTAANRLLQEIISID